MGEMESPLPEPGGLSTIVLLIQTEQTLKAARMCSLSGV